MSQPAKSLDKQSEPQSERSGTNRMVMYRPLTKYRMVICEHVHVLHFDRLLNHKVECDLNPNMKALFPNRVNRKVIGTNKMVIFEQQMYFCMSCI